MGLGQGLGDGQPDARPSVSPVTSGVNPVEAVEYAGQVLRGDALAGVLDAQFRDTRSGGAGGLRPAPDTTGGDSASFFALGVFSGLASSCCAPVLVGVMTLSALAGSPLGGMVLGLAYVFGMAFPLFVMALAWDRFHLGERKFLKARPVRLHLGTHILATNTVNLVVAGAFTVMGGFVIYLAGSGQMTSGPGFQVAFGKHLASTFGWVQKATAGVPEVLLGLVVLALAAVFIYATLRDRRRGGPPPPPDDDLQSGAQPCPQPETADVSSTHN